MTDKIAIYGAGLNGRAFQEALESEGLIIGCFIDQFIKDREINGKPVYRIDEISDKNIVVYVSVALNPVAQGDRSDIVSQLNDFGFKSVYGFLDSIRKFKKILPFIISNKLLWMNSEPDGYVDNCELAKVRRLLCDKKSRRLLDKIVSFRSKPTADNYVVPDKETEYFPADIDLLASVDRLRFIDCGAYTGDTIRSVMDYANKTGKSIDYIVSFEPDKKNYTKLQEELVKQHSGADKVIMIGYPAGVWSTNKTLEFSETGTSSSSIMFSDHSEEHSGKVQVISLDETLYSASPNYIKMDIEGAEREALLGARNMIRDQSPVMAICVYHKPHDLWELPLLVNSINSEYDMYLRTHSHMCISTVLYCVPRQQNK